MYKFLAIVLLMLSLVGCKNDDDNKAYKPQYSSVPVNMAKPVYIFGVHPLHNAERLFEVYQPMIDYINARLDNAQLRLESSRDYPSYEKKIVSHHFDFALPNPYQTIMSEEHGYVIFGKMGDDQNFRGIILVRKDSGIDTIDDLKGKVISYPAATALAATMLPQWYLHEHGIDVKKDIKNSYVGSQESAIMNVYLKKSDAGATWPPPWHAFIKQRPEIAEEVVVKWETFSLPNNGLVARKDVPAHVVKKVADIIVNMHRDEEGKKILKGMELSRYERADTKTYKPVRNFLIKFEREVRQIKDDR